MATVKRNFINMVCTANVCRSPVAEKLLAHALAKEAAPLNELTVISSGVSAMHGDGVSTYSKKVLENVGITLNDHKSKPFSQEMAEQSFAVFCMTSTHKLMLETQFHASLPKHVYLMRELIPNNLDLEIPDPYGLDLEDYEACRDSIVEAIPSIIAFLKENYKAS